MNIQFTFKHMTSSQALQDLASQKLTAKIDRFTARPLHAHVTFSIEGGLQKMHVSLITSDGYDIEAEHVGEDMYAEIDVVAEKVESQLRKHKERLTNRKGPALKEQVSSLLKNSEAEDQFVEDSYDDDAIDAAEILGAPTKEAHSPAEVLR